MGQTRAQRQLKVLAKCDANPPKPKQLEDARQGKWSIDTDTQSPLVNRVQALEQVQRVENYLFATTYGSDGRGSRTWSQWYADIQDAVQLLRESERLLRHDVARALALNLSKEDTMAASKVCYQVTIAGYEITLSQKGKDNFAVQYGKLYTGFLPYHEAALELGACIMHALACDSKLDNRTKGEN
jgi:hypothetical protein